MANKARSGTTERRSGQEGAAAPSIQLERKPSQRDRLLSAMIELAGRVGYQAVSIAQVSATAGVSRATFYEQFVDKEDCLLAAWRMAAERLLLEELPSSVGEDWQQAASSLLHGIALALEHDPDAGRLLFVEMPTGGARTRETRRAVLGAFERQVEEFIDLAPRGQTIDVPPVAVLGAMRSIIARYLRTRSEDELAGISDDGIAWVLSYARQGGERWSTSDDALLLPMPEVANPAQTARPRPRRLPRGRHGLPAGVIARSQRTRIIHGTAEVMRVKGYEGSTVADIVAAAGVSRDVFYEHFADKQNAFLEAQQHPTQFILDSCAAAYFGAGDWVERIWRTFAALLELIVANPAISHLRLVECYAAGPDAIRRAEEITRSFTIFLEEGYSLRGDMPRISSLAIAGAIFELIQRDVARSEGARLLRRLPQLTYIATAPFVGPGEAIERIRQLRESGRPGAA